MPSLIPYVPNKDNSAGYDYAPPTLQDAAQGSFVPWRPLAADTWGPLFDWVLWITNLVKSFFKNVDLPYASSLSPVWEDGPQRTCTLTDAATLNPITGSPPLNAEWSCLFTSSGGDHQLYLDETIQSQLRYGNHLQFTIYDTSSLLVKLRWNGTNWVFVGQDGTDSDGQNYGFNGHADSASINYGANSHTSSGGINDADFAMATRSGHNTAAYGSADGIGARNILQDAKAWASGNYINPGDVQTVRMMLAANTDDATPTAVFSPNSSAYYGVGDVGKSATVYVKIHAKVNGATGAATYSAQYRVIFDGYSGVINSALYPNSRNDIGVGGVAFSHSGTDLVITVTGKAGTEIMWSVQIEAIEAAFNV